MLLGKYVKFESEFHYSQKKKKKRKINVQGIKWVLEDKDRKSSTEKKVIKILLEKDMFPKPEVKYRQFLSCATLKMKENLKSLK